MKKFLLLLCVALFSFSCDKGASEEDEIFDRNIDVVEEATTLTSFDNVLMSKRVSLNAEKSVLLNYLIATFDNERKVLIPFEYKTFQPSIGMKVSQYKTYNYCSFEAYEISTEKGKINVDVQLKYIKDNVLSKEPKTFTPLEKTGIVEESFFLETRENIVWDVAAQDPSYEFYFVRIDGLLYYALVETYQMRDAVESIEEGMKVRFSLSNERTLSCIEEDK